VQKDLTLTNHACSPTIAAMNKTKFDAMPAELQKTVLDCAREAVAFHRDFNAKENSRILQELKTQGLQVNEQPDMTPFRRIVYATLRQACVDKNGAELIEAMEGEK
jgi:TRAP-type transport system periplasmic protein